MRKRVISDSRQTGRSYFEEMRRSYVLMVFMFSYLLLAEKGAGSIRCANVLTHCQQNGSNIPRCVENAMRNCGKSLPRGFHSPDFYLRAANSSRAARVDTVYGHVIQVPSEAVLKSKSENDVYLIVSVLNSSLFEAPSDNGSLHEQVLGVWLGDQDVHDLSHPVRIKFVNVSQNESRKCVFWKMSKNSEQGKWSTDGCNTSQNNKDFVCECNHLSFFAVLVSPDMPEKVDTQPLEYITYVGSSLSVVFTVIALMLFLCHRKIKAEHSVIIHMQLTGSMFLLHLFFLASSFWSEAEGAACRSLGLMLHWALLGTLTWTAIEGFHLYLLLVRVFNIYIRRYTLKLILVGWGVPTITVMICGVAGSYGKYTLTVNTSNITNLCWVPTAAVRYITVNGYLGLVLLFNIAILAVTVVKMRQLRLRTVQTTSRVRRFWKDWATVLGLSCVLGLPWGLAFTTKGLINLPGVYVFTILNAFQGALMFLWFLSITCKSNHEEQSSKDISLSNIRS
ncbi:adhesion G-protein coupled receptor G5-like [Colossoma macropomum]|uniref:adhesion G-protein coupled receptor G5-like n=1 Tax=Colossoma macropomum TaxID=42526 RepID=UPI00186537E6|nr:adhesion G-protein coupled receptor G5-like [Colossoma macropomum]